MGILAGTITGFIPGVHINLVGTILVSLSATSLFFIPPTYLVVFISAMAISHTFIDFIPSIFLGCPDTETQLSVLPGHEMLKKGKGYEAVRLTSKGGLYAIFLLIILSFPLSFLISKIYSSLHSVMFFILLTSCLLLILTEKRKFLALFVFLISGIFGVCVLNSGINEPLFPMLTGLFGSSLLILSIKNRIEIPKQEITESNEKVSKPLVGSFLASIICGFLPGLGGGQAAVLGNLISKTTKKGFLILVGATNVLVMGISFVSLYAISKTRTGAAIAIQELIGNLSWKILLLILISVFLSGIASYFITKSLSKFLIKKINRINYSSLSVIVLFFLILLTVIISGFYGLLILFASTLLGIYCNSLPIKKTHMMGCLLLPTLVYYFLELI